jgi:hypothetical protein
MIGRLRESLARERVDRQDPAMRALCFLFLVSAQFLDGKRSQRHSPRTTAFRFFLADTRFGLLGATNYCKLCRF